MPTDFGTDLKTTADGDLDITGALTNGRQVLAEDMRRRFSSPEGSVFWAPGESMDLTSFLSKGFTARTLLALRTRINRIAKLDERVLQAKSSVDFNAATRSMRVTIALETLAGPFDLVLGVTDTSVELLQAA